MPIIYFNLEWMSFNIILALFGVIFAYLLFKSSNLFSRIVFFILWLLFIPNTTYLLTDLLHLPRQFGRLESSLQPILIVQYIFIVLMGLTTYFLSFNFFEKSLTRLNLSSNFKSIIIILLNYPIAFGVALGRFERVHSWFVVTDPSKVFQSSISLLSSLEMMTVILLFGSLMNLLYFLLKQLVNTPVKFQC